ncbi:hydroxymethylbilane synthase [Nonomuraea sp. NPDC049784]|uniref:hydroxymethylbilane synthase n=1 Tax=Nonomuraea sp. NPDC049784 TaxID=3154361 RepID=UPI0034083AC3
MMSAASGRAMSLRLGSLAGLPVDAIADEIGLLTGRQVLHVPVESAPDDDQAVGAGHHAHDRASALRAQLLAGEIDCAVHAVPDLPATPQSGLTLAATPARDDIRDVLVASTLWADLHPGATVATTSARRPAMLRRLRSDLRFHVLDGDLGSCLSLLHRGEVDALVCAGAHLRRHSPEIDSAETFAIEHLFPEPGQGALALECLSDRHDVVTTVRVLHDPRTWHATIAERTVQAAMPSDENVIIGTYAVDDGHLVSLTAAAFSPDGRYAARSFGTCASADCETLGHFVAADLRAAVTAWPTSTDSEAAP